MSRKRSPSPLKYIYKELRAQGYEARTHTRPNRLIMSLEGVTVTVFYSSNEWIYEADVCPLEDIGKEHIDTLAACLCRTAEDHLPIFRYITRRAVVTRLQTSGGPLVIGQFLDIIAMIISEVHLVRDHIRDSGYLVDELFLSKVWRPEENAQGGETAEE